MTVINFDYSQYARYMQSYKQLAKEFDEFLKRYLLEMAMRIVERTKPRTPWDTGALRATWGIGEQEFQQFSAMGLAQKDWSGEEIDYQNTQIDVIEVAGRELTISIWNPMEYASHVEFGTPARPNWKWAEGAKMLTISMDEIEQQMPDRFEQMFQAWCQEMGID